MLYKGKRDGFFLYELTEADLIWEQQGQSRYEVGNVLLFTNKKDISLGSESVKADDLVTALDYLGGNVEFMEPKTGPELDTVSLEERLAESEAKVEWLDNLLRDVSADLSSQRDSNQILIAQLEGLHEQVNIEKLSKREVIGDLEVASAETYRIDRELQEAIDAKTLLEQELAESICKLMELDSANSDLQQRLVERTYESPVAQDGAVSDAPRVLPPAEGAAAFPVELDATAFPEIAAATNLERASSSTREGDTTALKEGADSTTRDSTAASTPEGATASTREAATPNGFQVFTSSAGKQIHVYHEFPLSKSRSRQRGVAVFQGLARVIGLAVVGLLVFIAGSVIATAALNDITFGEALDTILKTVLPW